MDKKQFEALLNSEMREIKGGGSAIDHDCICQSGAGQTVIIAQNPGPLEKRA